MSEKNLNDEPPERHRQYLEDCEKALVDGQDSFISLDEFEADLRKEVK